LTIERSAWLVTVVCALEELLAGIGSVAAELTVAVLVKGLGPE
jgi:hypothetical protein